MKTKIYALTLAVMFAMAPALVSANDKNPKKTELTEQQKIRVEQITNRVKEIKAMDRSALSAEQRKQLRTELKAMKKEAKALSGGVYLSATAIIIILLVLILIT